MIIYSVTCTVENSIAEEWEKFFIEKHLDDLVKTGYFTAYSFCKIVETSTHETSSFRSEYYAPDLEHLEQYRLGPAKALKQEVVDLFKGKFTCQRTVYEVRHTR